MFSEERNIFKDPISYKLIIVVQVICKQQCLTRVKIELSCSRRIYSKGPNHFKLFYINKPFQFYTKFEERIEQSVQIFNWLPSM